MDREIKPGNIIDRRNYPHLGNATNKPAETSFKCLADSTGKSDCENNTAFFYNGKMYWMQNPIHPDCHRCAVAILAGK